MIRKCRDFLQLLAPQFKLERVIFLSCKDMTFIISYSDLPNTQGLISAHSRVFLIVAFCTDLPGEFLKNDMKMLWFFTTYVTADKTWVMGMESFKFCVWNQFWPKITLHGSHILLNIWLSPAKYETYKCCCKSRLINITYF